MKSHSGRIKRLFLFCSFIAFFLPFLILPSLTLGATGEVQFSTNALYQFGTAGSFGNNGNTYAKLFDGSFTTNWDAPTASSAYAGLDLTVNAKVTRLLIAPRVGYLERLYGVVFQGATVSSSTGPWTTLYTFPSAFPPLYSQKQFTEIPINTGSSYYRYYRLVSANNAYGSIAEVRMLGIASSTTPYVPATPVIFPMGGRYENPIKVTLSSPTTDASLYYTTDGTTPTFSGGSPQGTTLLYSSPFTISSSGTTTVKAIAVSAGTYVSEVTDPGLFFISSAIKSAHDWYDDRGRLIEGHMGDIRYFNGTYYWYGQSMNNSSPTIEISGLKAYSSPDLLNWTDRGNVYYINNATTIRGPSVIYNATSSLYVMWAYNKTNGRVIIATSTTPVGSFNTATTTYMPDGNGVAELSLFQETNGTAYVTYVDSARTYLYISQLSSDYMTVNGTFARPYNGGGASAAPAMFKRGSEYFLMMNQGYSAGSPWASQINRYATSSNPTGTWSSFSNPFQSSGSEDNTVAYHSQVSRVVQVQGRNDAFIYIGDRFDGSNTANGSLYNSRYVWLPVSFPDSTSMSLSWQPSWTLDGTFTTSSAPSAASGVTATKNGLSVDLAWTNNETAAFALYVERATNNIFTQNLYAVPLNAASTTYTDTNIVNGDTYYYRIKTVTAAGSTNSSTVIGDFNIALDTTPPVVQLTAPLNGVNVQGTISLTASSTDNIGVTGIQFKINDEPVGSLGLSSPHSISWNSTGVSDGTYSIVAVANDLAGNYATSTAAMVYVVNLVPTITVATSTVMQGATSTAIAVTGNATSWSAGTPGTPTFTLTGGTGASIVSQSITNSTTGTITVKSGSSVGRLILTDPTTSATTSIDVLADTSAPVGTITSPSNGANVAGPSVTLTTTTSDDVGIASIQFKVSNTSVGAVGSTTPYSVTWDSTTVSDGSKSIVAVITDLSGNISTSTAVTVTVINSVAPTATTTAATGTGSFATTLNGDITSTGGSSASARGFIYGLTQSYGATTTESGTFGTGAFSSTVTNLSCSTLYYYRAYATNLAGTSYGPVKNVTTTTCPTVTATGQVALSKAPAYQFGVNTSYLNSGNTVTKVFDDNVLTWWDTQQADGAYAGLDGKVPTLPTAITITPRAGYTVRVYGAIFQGSNTATTGPWTNIHTIASWPASPYLPQKHVNTIDIDSSGAMYRYYRILMPNGTNANLAEFGVIVTSTSTAPYKPVTPNITPHGGRYFKPLLVRLSSRTTNAALYYTTDGTDPSFASGAPQGTTQLYTGPFLITNTATTTVKTIAVSDNGYVSRVSDPAYFYIDRSINSGYDWFDTNTGQLIESHDGEVKFFEGKYYWYGQVFNGNDPEVEKVAVSVYSSSDLINWRDEGAALYQGRQWNLERPHVLYNPTTDKYVMWAHQVIPAGQSVAFVAYSSTPYGPYTVASTSLNPLGVYLNDMNLYQDDDGTGYLLYSRGDNTGFYIARLTSDYLDVDGTYISPAFLAGREAPAVFKRNNIYYLVHSGLTGWPPNLNKYSTSTSMLGTWSGLVVPFLANPYEDYNLSYRSQTTNIISLANRGNDARIYMGDRFISTDVQGGSLYHSRHIWLPMVFSGNDFTIPWNPTWDLDQVFPTVTGPASATSLTATDHNTYASLTWTNNESVSTDVYIERATNSAFTQNVISELLTATTTSYTDNYNYSNATQYFYRIRTVTGDGSSFSSTVSVNDVDTTAPTPTMTSPANSSTISGITPITASATDNWSVASMRFAIDGSYIATTSSGSTHGIAWDSSTVADGSHTLSVEATDASLNQATSTISITVDNTAPIRSNGSPSGTLGSGITSTSISLTTNEAATCKFSTTTGTSYNSMTLMTNTGTTTHQYTATDLVDNTNYSYFVRCQDSRSITNNDDYTISFAIAATPDTTAPIISSVATSSIGASGATITWTTDEGATGQIEYGLTSSYTNTSATQSSYLTSHSISLSGLNSETLYHFRIVSNDSSSNIATSSDYTFTTSVADQTPVINPVNLIVTYSGGATQVSSTPTLSQTITPTNGTSETKTLQSLLIKLGLLAPGNDTGYYGPLTKKAVQLFLENGKVEAPTPVLSPFTKTVTFGQTHSEVKKLQQFLSRYPDIYPQAKTTGYFGKETEKALGLFQLKYGIITSKNDPGYGIFGPRTRAKINSLLK